MKKLKLSLQTLKGAEVLSREQLKKIMGGDGESGSGDCKDECSTDKPCKAPQYCATVACGGNRTYQMCI